MGMIPSVIVGCVGMLGAEHDASVTVRLSSRGAAGGWRFRLLVVLTEAKDRDAAPWRRPIGAFWVRGASICHGSPKQRTIALTT